MDKDLKIIYSVWILAVVSSVIFLPLISSSPALTDNLITYLKLDETSGTIAVDSLGLNNFTNVGATVNVSGKINTAYNFTDTDYLNHSSFTNLPVGAENRTVCFWVYPEVATDDYMFTYGSAALRQGFGIAYLTGTQFYTWVNGDDMTGANTHAVNNWYFVCVTYDGTTTRLYVNGVNEGNKTQTLNTASTTLYIGTYITGLLGLWGKLDEWDIYNRTLSVSEIQEKYNSGDGLSYPFVADTCTCAGAGNDWEIAMSDYCNITTACDLTTGTLSFTGAGYCNCNASVDTTNLGDPGASGILYIQDSCLITID